MERRRYGAGRPRKSGPREPNGRLKRREAPNPAVMRARRYLCDNPKLATSPRDVALGRGWIGAEAHEAGRSFAMLCWRSGLITKAGTLRGAAPSARLERSEDVAERAPFANLDHAALAAIWDRAFEPRRGAPDEAAAELALQRLRWVTRSLSTSERSLLFGVCALEDWPAWLFAAIAVERAERPADLNLAALRDKARFVAALNRLDFRRAAA